MRLSSSTEDFVGNDVKFRRLTESNIWALYELAEEIEDPELAGTETDEEPGSEPVELAKCEMAVLPETCLSISLTS